MRPAVYCFGTKKWANDMIKRGDDKALANCLIEFNMFAGNRTWSFYDLPDGAVFKFWKKKDSKGTPIAKAYGNKRGNKII